MKPSLKKNAVFVFVPLIKKENFTNLPQIKPFTSLPLHYCNVTLLLREQ